MLPSPKTRESATELTADVAVSVARAEPVSPAGLGVYRHHPLQRVSALRSTINPHGAGGGRIFNGPSAFQLSFRDHIRGSMSAKPASLTTDTDEHRRFPLGSIKLPEPQVKDHLWTPKLPFDQAWPVPAASTAPQTHSDASGQALGNSNNSHPSRRQVAPPHSEHQPLQQQYQQQHHQYQNHHQQQQHARIPGGDYLPPVPYHHHTDDHARWIDERRESYYNARDAYERRLAYHDGGYGYDIRPAAYARHPHSPERYRSPRTGYYGDDRQRFYEEGRRHRDRPANEGPRRRSRSATRHR